MNPLYSRWLQGSLILYPPAERGNIFMVDSVNGLDTNTGLDWANALATIDAAIGKCTADQGDKIFVSPKHAETIALATSMVCDKDGVSIIGLGVGAQRPLLTFTAAASTIAISAADVHLHNLRLCSAFTNGVTAGIGVAATADGLKLTDLEMTETLVTQEWLKGIEFAAGVSDVLIQGLRFIGIPLGGMSSVINAVGAVDRLRFVDNFISGDASAAIVKLDGAASADIYVVGNHVLNIDAAAGLGIAIHNDTTGFAHDNHSVNLKDTVVGITGTGMSYGRNYYSNAVNKSTRLAPAEDA